jgi:hypothetical protein
MPPQEITFLETHFQKGHCQFPNLGYFRMRLSIREEFKARDFVFRKVIENLRM